MEQIRQHKIEKTFQKVLGTIFQKNQNEYCPNRLVSVTHVDIAPNLSSVKIYLSFFPHDPQQNLLQPIENKKSEIKRAIVKILGKKMRKMPELHFFLDTTQKDADRIQQALSKLNIPPQQD